MRPSCTSSTVLAISNSCVRPSLDQRRVGLGRTSSQRHLLAAILAAYFRAVQSCCFAIPRNRLRCGSMKTPSKPSRIPREPHRMCRRSPALLSRFPAGIKSEGPFPLRRRVRGADRAGDGADMDVAEIDQPAVGTVGIAAAREGLVRGHERYQSGSSRPGQIAHYWHPVAARTTT